MINYTTGKLSSLFRLTPATRSLIMLIGLAGRTVADDCKIFVERHFTHKYQLSDDAELECLTVETKDKSSYRVIMAHSPQDLIAPPIISSFRQVSEECDAEVRAYTYGDSKEEDRFNTEKFKEDDFYRTALSLQKEVGIKEHPGFSSVIETNYYGIFLSNREIPHAFEICIREKFTKALEQILSTSVSGLMLVAAPKDFRLMLLSEPPPFSILEWLNTFTPFQLGISALGILIAIEKLYVGYQYLKRKQADFYWEQAVNRAQHQLENLPNNNERFKALVAAGYKGETPRGYECFLSRMDCMTLPASLLPSSVPKFQGMQTHPNDTDPNAQNLGLLRIPAELPDKITYARSLFLNNPAFKRLTPNDIDVVEKKREEINGWLEEKEKEFHVGHSEAKGEDAQASGLRQRL